MIEDVYFSDPDGPAYVRQWDLIDGRAQCPLDAILATSPGAVAALQKNAAVRAMITAVLAYEAALTIVAKGEPAPDDPARPAYDDAEAEIATATDITKALARWREAEGEHGVETETVAEDEQESQGQSWEADRDAVLAALETVAEIPLAIDPRPVKESISRRQFGYGAVMVGKMTQAEALAFVNLGTLPAAVETVVAALPGPQQFAARMSLASNEFHRHNPATLQFLPLLAIDSATADAAWRYGASFA